MKKLLMTVSLVAMFSGAALAHDKVVILKAKNGDVKFEHAKHKAVKKECMACHESDKGGKIADIGKDWAHKTCKGCHEEMKSGPTSCGGCHKK